MTLLLLEKFPTIEELLHNAEVKMPPQFGTFKQAQRVQQADAEDEFWLYETWESEEAVNKHESGEEFKQYKENLRLLVEGESVIWGNTEPVQILGYKIS
jgi:heme-degrading monooxygenase HmoA